MKPELGDIRIYAVDSATPLLIGSNVTRERGWTIDLKNQALNDAGDVSPRLSVVGEDRLFLTTRWRPHDEKDRRNLNEGQEGPHDRIRESLQ